MAILEDERTFSDMEVKAAPTGADYLQIADAADGGRVKKILISSILSQDGTDTNAIHVDVASEIHALTDKPLPLLADELVAETSTASAWTKVRMAVGNLFKTVGWIDGLTAKTAPTASDTLAIGDAAAAGAPKKSTLQQLFAALGLIDGLTEKAVPVAADTLAINDSAAAGAAKKSTLQQLFAALGLIDGLTSKATPVSADTFAINDSAAGGAAKKVALSTVVLVSNNLSDVTAATARANLVANRKTLIFSRVNVVGATASVYRYVNTSGYAQTILSIASALTAALATGDATITASINATPVTTGVVTIAESGSAAGTIDSCTPSAANVIGLGQVLELTVGGGNDAAVFADVSVELSY
jgi:hypothetical protein